MEVQYKSWKQFILLIVWISTFISSCSGSGCTPIFHGTQLSHPPEESNGTASSIILLEGSSFYLTCSVRRAYTLKWNLRNDVELIEKDKVFSVQNYPEDETRGVKSSRLEATNALRNHTGVYHCVLSGCPDQPSPGLFIKVVYADLPTIDFQLTKPRVPIEDNDVGLIIPGSLDTPTTLSCITKIIPNLSAKWRRKTQVNEDTTWVEMEKSCEVKYDEDVKKEEKFWFSKEAKGLDAKCFIFKTKLEDGTKNMSLFFTSLKKSDYGDYSCGITSDPAKNPKTDRIVTLEVNIVATRKFKGGASSLTVIEGDQAEIYCNLSWPGPNARRENGGNGPAYKVRWYKDDIEFLEDPAKNVSIKTNESLTVIIIANTSMLDRGTYKCVIVDANELRVSSFPYMLRVRGRMAALWPFIAIIVEVIVICLIILIYEKTKTKADGADSDTDGSPDQKNGSDNDAGSEVVRLQQKE